MDVRSYMSKVLKISDLLVTMISSNTFTFWVCRKLFTYRQLHSCEYSNECTTHFPASFEETIVLNDAANKVLILLSKDFIEMNRTKYNVKSGSYKLDADTNTLLLGEKKSQGILYYLSNKTGLSDWSLTSFYGNIFMYLLNFNIVLNQQLK